jgi:hypothetical protein
MDIKSSCVDCEQESGRSGAMDEVGNIFVNVDDDMFVF